MKYLYVATFVMLLVGCQKENFEIVEEEQETSFVLDAESKEMIQSVTSHDGRFDDVVDKSSCFSINFPYEVIQEGKAIPIEGIEDLESLNPYLPVIPKFPIEISFATYETLSVPSESEFNSLVVSCANGQLYDDRIVCVDFEYPISVSIYETQSQSFETLIFNHDKDVFMGVKEIPLDALVNLQFPITLHYYDGTYRVIQDIEDLKQSIIRVIAVCN